MDAVVRSSDLLALIFVGIYVPASNYPTVQETEAFKCLSQCARVNRLWHDESCRLLWKRQLKLTNITRLLNPDTSLLNLLLVERKRYNLNDFSRFAHYSKWICDLTASDLWHSDDRVDLYLLTGGRSLFPHLETLSFDNTAGATSVTALELLGPTLKSLSFDGCFCLPENILLILDRLKMKSIQLNKLLMPRQAMTMKLSHDNQRCLLDVISQQQSLTSLSLHPMWVDCDLFCAIASLPGLSTLNIWNNVLGRIQLVANTLYDDSVLKQQKQKKLWFPSLTHLSLSLHGLAVTNLLKSVFISTKLQVLDLWLQSRTEVQTGSTLTLLPPCQSSLSNVEDIKVKVGGSHDSLIPRLTAASLKPISDFSLLRLLTVSTSRIPQMDDNDLLGLSKNWPHLSQLHFVDMLSVSRNDTCNFSSVLIAKIPAICPKLSSMSLPVSHSGEPLEVHRPRYQGLQSLNLGLSFFFDSQGPGWKDEVILIAAYLAAVTPFSCKVGFIAFRGVDYDELTHDMADAEWDMLVEAHEQTKSSICTHMRASRISQGIAAALGEKGTCMLSSSQNFMGFSSV